MSIWVFFVIPCPTIIGKTGEMASCDVLRTKIASMAKKDVEDSNGCSKLSQKTFCF